MSQRSPSISNHNRTLSDAGHSGGDALKVPRARDDFREVSTFTRPDGHRLPSDGRGNTSSLRLQQEERFHVDLPAAGTLPFLRQWIGLIHTLFCRLVAGETLKYSTRMKLLERITVESGKCGGRPCIRGLRIRVTDILGMLAEGVSHEEILKDFPYLEPDDIKAALAYAARQADHAVLQPA